MPLTQLTVTGGANGWVNPDGSLPSGTVTLQPLQEVSGGGYIVVSTPKTFTVLNGAIQAPNQIANNSQATILQYLVTEQIAGAQNPPPYVVSPTGSTLDLSTAARGSGPVTPLYVQVSTLAVPNGVATLGSDGTLTAAQRPPAGSGSVTSVTAADSTIVIGGTPTVAPTVKVGSIAESQVTNLTSDLATLTTGLAAKATKLIVRDGWVTSGDINPLPNTAGAWQALAGFEIDLPAAVGDRVFLDVNGMRKDATGNSWLDQGVIVGTSIKRFLSSGGATPGIEGDPGWYVPSGGITSRGGLRSFVVTSNDLDTIASVTYVRFVIAVKSNGSGIMYSSTNYPFYWFAANLGATN